VSYTYEKAFDEYIQGTTATSSEGLLRDAENRPARGSSVFAQNRFTVGSRFTVTPGLRYERYGYERNITIARVNNIPTNVDIRGKGDVSAFVPGIGVTFQAADGLNTVGTTRQACDIWPETVLTPRLPISPWILKTR
jgi:outer membrane receptor for Fe3+-dicitrate